MMSADRFELEHAEPLHRHAHVEVHAPQNACRCIATLAISLDRCNTAAMLGTGTLRANGLSRFQMILQPEMDGRRPCSFCMSHSELTSTAMVVPPSVSWRMMSAGRLHRKPPSTSRSPLWTSGGKMPGNPALARNPIQSGPSRWTTISARDRLLDTQKNGSHMSSMRTSPMMARRRDVLRCPFRIAITGNVRSRLPLAENLLVAPGHPLRIPPERMLGRDAGAHARPTDHVDWDTGLVSACRNPMCAKPRAPPPLK